MQHSKAILDPVGTAICLPEFLINQIIEVLENESLFDQVQDVIRKPAFLIKVNREGEELLYYRLVSDERSILLMVKMDGSFWKAYNYVINPESTFLLELMASGENIYP